jgi:hypothetical protein
MQVTAQHHSSAALPPGENPVPDQHKAELAPQTLYTMWRREISLAPASIRNSGLPARGLVTTPSIH